MANIYLHPVARAAWVGMFTTALNLLPIGQLDVCHVLYSFFPARHRMVSRIVAVLLLPLAKLLPGWALWSGRDALVGPLSSHHHRCFWR